MFKKAFRTAGAPNLSTFLTNYKVGDIVDIVASELLPSLAQQPANLEKRF